MLESARDSYRDEKKTFDAAVSAGTNSNIIPSDIEAIEDELYKLESNGQQLKKIISEIRKYVENLNKPENIFENRHKVQKPIKDGKKRRIWNWFTKIFKKN